MIDHFLGDAFEVLSRPFWSTSCSAVWCSAADTHLKLLDRAVSSSRFLTGYVLQCDIAHSRSVAVLCMLYKIRCNPMQPLNNALYLDRMCQCGLHAVPWLHIGVLVHRIAAEPGSTAGLLFHSKCPFGTIVLTPYSMVCYWRVSRAWPMPFQLLYPF